MKRSGKTDTIISCKCELRSCEDAVITERTCERVSFRGNLGEIKIIASLWHGIALPVGRIGDVATRVRLPYRRTGKCLEGNKNCAHKEQY